ncbi:MAG: LiaF-related protein [Bacteroidales bacterium]|nr:LiaF-related protein [Bacteroidales bacterium]
MKNTQHQNSFLHKFGFASLLIFIGIFLLCLQLNLFSEQWKHIVFSWKMLVFVIGLVICLKGYRLSGGIIMAVGLFFLAPALLPKICPDVDKSYFSNFTEKYWAILLIIAGVGIAIKKHSASKCNSSCTKKSHIFSSKKHNFDEGFIQKKCAFSSCEYTITTPEFTGGMIECAFGSILIDLRRTQLPTTPVTLAIKVAFGAVEICVPNDWAVQLNVDTSMGAMEDTRDKSSVNAISNKKLIVTGSIAFGGGEVRA